MITLLDDFLVRAALAGLGVALAAAPLGCFVVWRRMAYFGDSTAHAAILGVALALAFSMPIFIGTLIVALAMAITVFVLSTQRQGIDTLLGVLAHSTLAAGLVAVSFLTDVRLDLSSYLFGDILAVGHADMAVIWGGGAAVVLLLWARWSALLMTTLNPDLALAAGIFPQRERLVLMVALAVVVAVAIKVVGALLITALLIIPAASARPFATTSEHMAMVAAGIGAASALGGLAVSYQVDTPAGPTIVCIAALFFLLANIKSFWRQSPR